MKVQVLNPNNIVQNAFIKQTDLSFSLFINTVDKWRRYESHSSGYDTHISDHPSQAWHYESDTVIIIAETDHDSEIFGRIPFELHDTDQLWILFPKQVVYK